MRLAYAIAEQRAFFHGLSRALARQILPPASLKERKAQGAASSRMSPARGRQRSARAASEAFGSKPPLASSPAGSPLLRPSCKEQNAKLLR